MAFPILTELSDRGKLAINYMRAKEYKVRALNIIYFEGIDPDLKTTNDDKIDQWNDVRSIITDKGDVLMACIATTEPGWYYRLNPMNPGGAAQLAFGQYLDAWEIGNHKGQDALIQCGTLKVYRDKNEDGSRKGDALDVGNDFGLDQHTTASHVSDYSPDTVGRWSAGCLVGKYSATHYDKFMPIVKSMGLKTFDSTLIDGSEFAEYCQQS